jgi:hypothetical protein
MHQDSRVGILIGCGMDVWGLPAIWEIDDSYSEDSGSGILRNGVTTCENARCFDAE